jgi:drug/metabolite transporter (DMT)-like permease
MGGYRLRLAFGVISLYTTAPLLVLMLLLGHHQKLAAVPGRVWPMIVLSGFIGIAFGHVFYHRGIHGIGPVVTSGITLGGPFVTCLAAFIFLGERITPVQLGGGVTVIAGGASLLVARAQAAREGPEVPGAGR